MTPKKRQTKQEDKTAAIDFLKKAQDSHETMLLAFKNENYNAVGTLAIQCAISSADAICVYEKGLRSISQDHGDICALVKSTLLPEANEKSNALKRILAKKNLIQYERRNVIETEAADLIKSATRIFEWVCLHLKN
ncbi:MAG: HEPN domain-containing protein [Candidatus Omnitrophica bacterium]|nr:HEPN domain-containing protein [Candidatus Omnitrophota bacterium]